MTDGLVSLHAKHSVTLQQKTCPNCPNSVTGRQTYCCNACRQAVYRNSSAYKASLKKLRDQRLRRRKAHYSRKFAFRSLGIRGWSGPLATDVPPIGAMDLKLY